MLAETLRPARNLMSWNNWHGAILAEVRSTHQVLDHLSTYSATVTSTEAKGYLHKCKHKRASWYRLFLGFLHRCKPWPFALPATTVNYVSPEGTPPHGHDDMYILDGDHPRY